MNSRNPTLFLTPSFFLLWGFLVPLCERGETSTTRRCSSASSDTATRTPSHHRSAKFSEFSHDAISHPALLIEGKHMLLSENLMTIGELIRCPCLDAVHSRGSIKSVARLPVYCTCWNTPCWFWPGYSRLRVSLRLHSTRVDSHTLDGQWSKRPNMNTTHARYCSILTCVPVAQIHFVVNVGYDMV